MHVENEKQLMRQEQRDVTAEPAAAARTQSVDGGGDVPVLADPAVPVAAAFQGESGRAEDFAAEIGPQTAEKSESSSLSKAISGWL